MLRSIRGTAKPRSHLLISGQNLWRGKNCSGLWKILVSKTPPRNLDAAAAPLLMMEIKTTSRKDLLLKSHKFILTVSPVFNLVQFFLFGWWWFHDEEKMELKLIFLVFLRHGLCEGARHKQGYLPGEPIINVLSRLQNSNLSDHGILEQASASLPDAWLSGEEKNLFAHPRFSLLLFVTHFFTNKFLSPILW